MLREDLKRLVRHLVPVLAIYAVEADLLPAAAQGPAVEGGIVLVTLLMSLLWSRKRDVAKEAAK